ncbi:lipoate--protein ligase family protein [Chlamydia muridarum str. Nigg]|jgi:Lipoate-protein ligase A|uniref:Lipoate--protein ligase n=2 Tax=Chlamydia muridarum TaxID=83560 RepID=A0A069ZQ09_CHLMR|nr:lipoate--protein ligase family protein [Chlamydia muridarum]UFW21336.1 lipoate--protein ligase family protein [Chlamydia trachomatis]AAF39589.1 lipoate-protein ligase-related protein [Chlamydia muridarum str. Nigg]AHH23172.1 lipoate-protein ligase A [Chlamydia muridarum str. Nigg3 CMUT3-5]AHH24098.1 lipoate-protein ligase A [Chlamydia muridarum str. Nigg CM972]AID38299.1 lipoate--protein ligase [Chlamydia muridarum str. Nigg 2 MCR]
MLTDCVFIHCEGIPIFQQLQLEEALLRTSSKNFCLVNTNLPEAAVLGISRNPEQDLHIKHLREDNIPVIRRYSGGGTVFLDANSLMVSWIMNSSSLFPSSKELLQWTSNIYIPIFPAGFKIKENDYVFFDKKIGGNAQYIQKQRWVHHTTFLWDMNAQKLARYLPIPQIQPSYRQNRSHNDFLTTIHPLFDSKEDFLSKMKWAATSTINWGEGSVKDFEQALNLPHRRATQIL